MEVQQQAREGAARLLADLDRAAVAVATDPCVHACAATRLGGRGEEAAAGVMDLGEWWWLLVPQVWACNGGSREPETRPGRAPDSLRGPGRAAGSTYTSRVAACTSMGGWDGMVRAACGVPLPI